MKSEHVATGTGTFKCEKFVLPETVITGFSFNWIAANDGDSE